MARQQPGEPHSAFNYGRLKYQTSPSGGNSNGSWFAVNGRLLVPWLLLLLLLTWCTAAPVNATKSQLKRTAHHNRFLLENLPLDASPTASDPPEWHNGIGDIKVFMFGDENDVGRANLERLKKHCSSKTVMLTSTNGRPWTWHDKINRLIREDFRSLHNSQIVMLLDGDLDCFPCTRSLATEFLKFGAGVVVAGYPYNQEPTRTKTAWLPPVALLDDYRSPEEDHIKNSLRLFKYLNTGTIIGLAGALKYFLSQHYLASGYVDWDKFDDQAGFWTNMYLAQEFSPWSRHYHSGVGHHKQEHESHVHHNERLIRIGVDAEGAIFQLSLLHYKGRWMRTEKGLQKELPYRKEACIIHFVGNKVGLNHLNHTAFDAAPVGSAVFGACPASATDTSIKWDDENSCVCKESHKLLTGA